ncbi:hypothetical protein EHS25_006222 [Saitozyma podzolica]|uniref:Uncharacterized protein n=1 Tax=Saitozyma podzolica TaxID=1890683 RepID=A0A427XRY5_9TREE|nr:hypothetical protein EHS25_006222 [Saitozyma podzolica]
MSISTPRSLLRLAQRRPSPCLCAHRTLATTLHHLPTPSPSLPYFPTASSSKQTLDHPLFLRPPPSDPISAALLFATDEDLVNALTSSPSSTSGASELSIATPLATGRDDWTSTTDPGLAFLALRSRPTYSPFLQSLRPYLHRLYHRLKASGTHQLLVSDLLLRHPDPRILADLLELDASSPLPDRLRPSLVVSLYTHLLPTISKPRQRRPLSRHANLYVAKVALSKSEIKLLPPLFDSLYPTTEWEPEGAWVLIRLILNTLPSDAASAVRMFRRLVADEHIPRDLLGRTNPRHPKFREVLVLSAIIRCCMDWKLYVRAEGIANDLVGVMRDSAPAEGGVDAVLELVRTSIAGKQVDQVTWAGKMIRDLAEGGIADIDGGLVTAFLETVPDQVAADWYLTLPLSCGPPSAAQLLCLATFRPLPDLLRRVARDILDVSPASTFAQRPVIIRLLSSAQMLEEIKTLYAEWLSDGSLDAPVLLQTLTAFKEDKPLCRDILAAFEERFADGFGAEQRLALVEGYLRLREKSMARRQLAAIDPRREEVREEMERAVLVSLHKEDLVRIMRDMGVTVDLESE